MIKHGEHCTPTEFTLCGLAFDAYETGDHPEPIVFAEPGTRVTCPDCRAVIDYCRKFVGYLAPKE